MRRPKLLFIHSLDLFVLLPQRPTSVPVEGDVKQPSCQAIFFQPSCVPGVLGRLLNKSLHYTPPSFWSILRNCCVHMWKSGAVTVTCEQQLSPGIFKLNKKLVLLSCRLDVAVCSSLSSAPRLPAVCPLFPSQPCSVYIADMPHEAREANVPEECQHEV